MRSGGARKEGCRIQDEGNNRRRFDGDLGGPAGPEVSRPGWKCPEKEVSKVKGWWELIFRSLEN